MLDTARHIALSPLIAAWLDISSQSWRRLPSPGSRHVSAANGPNADRVLLLGSGIAVGYGVTSPDLTLGGHLARHVAAVTRRGASVDTVAHIGMTAQDAPDALEDFDLARYDALVMTIGMDEALHLVPPETFSAAVRRLLGWVSTHAPSHLGLAMIGVPDVSTIMDVPKALRGMVQRRSGILDGILRVHCDRYDAVTYLPFEPKPVAPDGGREVYAAWAGLLAPSVATVLDARVGLERAPATIEEHLRQRALDEVDILGTGPEQRFNRIVADACRLFGVHGASITFVDRDRQWSKASIGIDPADSPRVNALADATVHNGKLFVVEDARADERFRGHPWVTGRSSVRFFAGFPIEAPNGERIGALCIMDRAPRRFTDAEDALLGMLARQVQAQLGGEQRRVGRAG